VIAAAGPLRDLKIIGLRAARAPHLAQLVKRQPTGGRAGGDAVGPGGWGCLFCSRMRCLAAA